jgi:formate dehydrogenase subunit gamma
MSQPELLLPHGRILRYQFHERLTHWVAAGSFIYLMLTGLAFYSPWLLWLAIVLGGPQVSRTLHPWAGLIFVVAVAYLYAMWHVQMYSGPTDKEWWKNIDHYTKNEDELMPPVGRYNPGQKLLFWGFVICGILLLLSGAILWFPEYIPWNLRWLRYAAVIVHPGAALLAIGLFMIHIYMSVFAERGAFGSVIRGDVSVEFAKRYHPAWYKEVVGDSPPPPK